MERRLRVLCVAMQRAEGERVESALRDAGLEVSVRHVSSLTPASASANGDWDLVVGHEPVAAGAKPALVARASLRPAPLRLVHDINNALSTVITFAELLVVDTSPSDPAHADALAIRAAGARVAALAQQLADVSRRAPSLSVTPRSESRPAKVD